MRIHWVWLATCPELTDRQRLALLEQFSDPEALFCADKQQILDFSGLSDEGKQALISRDLKPAQKILDLCGRKGIALCTLADPEYPSRLKNIADPPLVLYYKGTLPQWDVAPMIGVVGTRKASVYGLSAAQRLGFQLVRCGATVVSGAAEGIDGAAMAGALKADGHVVAVLGNGADVVYPKCNKGLYEDTLRHGCLLTEFPPETRPLKWNFPKRNRIISGLSNGVLVVEAPEKSGALITARQALDQGRDVFAVPGNLGVDSSAGTNGLLRDGAILVRDGWDVVSEYAAQYPETVRPYDPREQAERLTRTDRETAMVAQEPVKIKEKTKSDRKILKKPVDKEDAPPYIDWQERVNSLSDRERKIALLLDGEMLVDDLIAKAGLPAGSVLAVLTMLELRGFVTRLPGKRVAPKQKPK